MPTDTQKLRILRARTDHDLLVLVQQAVERGLNAAERATAKSSPSYIQAQKACETAAAMLPRIADLSQNDRLQIEDKLSQLRSRLDHIPTFANVQCFPASFAS